ncbi:hypothetical protein ZHAS_00006985 [Anopheles sinensis]|uniref:Uncharacterized protein n=1 Tax=Anopheles sinensis TaxID=74873 RepID=A0A084VNE5_ANOSI|nr:hypothetical protein ZHAS_00006985 [Anopheles sinensis]
MSLDHVDGSFPHRRTKQNKMERAKCIIKCDFKGAPRPPPEDVHTFVESKLKIKEEDVLTLHLLRQEPWAMITVNKMETAIHAVAMGTDATITTGQRP